MFHALERISRESVPLFSQLVHDYMLLFLKEFERYYPITKNPQIGKECICNQFVNKLREPIACLCKKKINYLRLQMTAAIKLRLKQQLCRCSGLKVMAEYPEIATTLLKTCCHF